MAYIDPMGILLISCGNSGVIRSDLLWGILALVFFLLSVAQLNTYNKVIVPIEDLLH